MAEASLQDRLRDHAKAFDGLLSLIPAKMYYGEEQAEDQWNKKKQTKAQARAARKGKLDPDSELNRNAKEVMDERAKNKRKLREMEQEEAGQQDSDYEAVDGIEAEKPREGLKKRVQNKKQKTQDGEDEEEESADSEDDEAPANATSSTAEAAPLTKQQQKLAAKKEKKKEKMKAKKEAKKASGEKKKAADASKTAGNPDAVSTSDEPNPTEESAEAAPEDSEPEVDTEDDGDVEGEEEEGKKAQKSRSKQQNVAFNGMQNGDDASASSNPESEPHSPTFDTTGLTAANAADPASTSTSVSSTVPPSEKPKHLKIPADTTALRARLAAKIEALRAARKADGPDGKPIRTRQELIESRRVKQAQRKEHKKELRKQARIEEQLKREQALASNSPSVMSPAVELDESGSFAFGRVAFGDGSQLSHDLSYVLSNGKRKGPSDPKTALLKVQNQKQRLEELDAEKRKDIAEKEAWLTARRRAEGEKIRDDEAILKKAVKRKEVAKKKSEKAWKDRSQGVEKAQKERQKKREDNIKKRREEKLLGKAGKKKKAGGGAKKKGRPGFEGSLGVGGRRK